MAQIGDLHDGDRVSWNTSQGRVTGSILRKATCRLYIHDYEVKASPQDPSFIVRSDRSGKLAAHKAAALKLLPS